MPCKRRRKCPALTTRFTANGQIRNKTSFLIAKPPALGFAAQKTETTVNRQKRARGSFTGKKEIPGREYKR